MFPCTKHYDHLVILSGSYYNETNANEEELLRDFSKECDDFITDSELEHLRGELRLARLLLAASFYGEGDLPPALGGDFIEAELQAVAEFDRYTETMGVRQEELASRVEEMETSSDSTSEDGAVGLAGDDVVTVSIARPLELDYLGGFDNTLGELDEVYTPDGPFEVPDGYWEGRSERLSERPRFSTLLDENEAHYAYPTNQTARYELVDSRYLGPSKQRRMVIEAVVFSHLEAYSNNDFDTRPTDLDDLLDLVNETVYEAEEGEYTHLLAIASQAGWTGRVRQQVRISFIRNPTQSANS